MNLTTITSGTSHLSALAGLLRSIATIFTSAAVYLDHSESCHIVNSLSVCNVADLDALLSYVGLHSLVHLIEREGVRDQIFDRNVHFLALTQERHGGGVVLCAVVPRTNDVDFLVTHSKVGADGVLAVVYEEAHLTHTAATTDVAEDISSSHGSAGALECEVNAYVVRNCLDLSNSLFQSVFIGSAEADGGLSAQLLCKLQTVFVTVNSNDVVNTCSTQYRDHHQTYGAATLQQNLGTELDQTGCLRALQSVYANACKLEQHSLIEVQVVNLEVGNALAALDYHVISEPTVEVVVGLVTDQTEYALLIAEVGSAGNHAACIALAAADNRGDDLVAYADGLTCGVELYVLTNCYNLTGTLVTKRYGE